ncbi:MAG: pyridoxamine 5'-phosphate oxidase family protein [Chloroflexi bacterium]|nr:pyridoxamine 5'-phosphate oxidase family protein [Chloroflexota bacterium]
MSRVPEIVAQAWERRQGPIVLTTVSADGTPNAIYASCVRRHDEEIFIIADNYMSKTRSNVLAGSKGALLFITEDHQAYQLKGILTYETCGLLYDEMKGWLDPRHPGHAAVVLHVQQGYTGATQIF